MASIGFQWATGPIAKLAGMFASNSSVVAEPERAPDPTPVMVAMPVAAEPAPHPTRSKPQTDKAMTPAISFFKALVRTARMIPGYPESDSYKLALKQSLGILPWLPAHYREVRGEDMGPNLWGTRIKTLAKYSAGEGLGKRKLSELTLARALLAEGREIGPEELAARLKAAHEGEVAPTPLAAPQPELPPVVPSIAAEVAEELRAMAQEGELRVILVG